MQQVQPVNSSPAPYLARHKPDVPVLFFAPSELQATARQFQAGFDGLVTYAVKANDRPEVLENLVAAGIRAFDVASPAEMAAVRAVCPDAVLHYNNPVRSQIEIAAGIKAGVRSWSVDDAGELAKLWQVPRDAEIAVRFKLPVAGAAYDFGDKFGTTPQDAATLLRAVVDMGFQPSLCFHPGTQCEDARAWVSYIAQAARICAASGVAVRRLNIGGGFAADRGMGCTDHAATFRAVQDAVTKYFGDTPPKLLCEPGRAMVAGSGVVATRVKAMRANGGAVFLNDGIYGGLVDLRDMGLTGLVSVLTSEGVARTGDTTARHVFGPTCDSLDQFPTQMPLPADLAEGDYVLFGGMGAYSIAMSTCFNGYGLHAVQTVAAFD